MRNGAALVAPEVVASRESRVARSIAGGWALSACCILVPSYLSAQAALTGVVRDSSKTAVAGIEVVIQALDKKATTDTAGRFVLGGLAHGAHVVLVRGIAYQPILLRAYLVTNDTLEVDLTIRKAVVELAPLEVTVSAIPLGLDAFEERRLEGFGTFIDWTTLRKSEHRKLAELLRGVPGVRIRSNRYGQPYLSGARGNCPMQIYLNGVVIFKPTVGAGSSTPPVIDLWNISELDAIEVYRGPSETPMQFSGSGSGCGTVVLWSRRG